LTALREKSLDLIDITTVDAAVVLDRAAKYYKCGQGRYEAGQFHEAFNDYDMAISLDPLYALLLWPKYEWAQRSSAALADAWARLHAEPWPSFANERKSEGARVPKAQATADIDAERMEQWKRSGMPREWVMKHLDGWDHAAWMSLWSQLQATPYWPLNADDVSGHLDALRGDLQADRDRKAEEERQRARKRKLADERNRAIRPNGEEIVCCIMCGRDTNARTGICARCYGPSRELK
jgi:hypothetical protein